MKIIEDAVLAKMNLQRLKAHRTSVLAHINSTFCATCTYCDPTHSYPIDPESQEYKDAIEYRNKVNRYYDSALAKNKAK